MKTEDWTYVDGTLPCRGMLLHGDVSSSPRPGIVLLPDARGMSETAKACAQRLAVHGFIVPVAELYGNATFAADLPEAQRLPAFAYDADTDRRSWQAMLQLFSEVFAG